MKQKMRTTLLKHGVEKTKIDSAMHQLGEDSGQWRSLTLSAATAVEAANAVEAAYRGAAKIAKKVRGKKKGKTPTSITNLFTCKKHNWTGTRRRGGARGDKTCKLVYKHDSMNKDRNHDPFVGAETYATAFTENGGKWWQKCPSDCNTCIAGINQGLDKMACCPNDAWTKRNPTEPQVNACAKRTDAESDLTQCGFASAKCAEFKVWYHQSGSTQIRTGEGLRSYEKAERRGGSWSWNSYKYVVWKHAKCTYKSSNSREATCINAKKCTCVSYHFGADCGSAVPKQVQAVAGMACGQY